MPSGLHAIFSIFSSSLPAPRHESAMANNKLKNLNGVGELEVSHRNLALPEESSLLSTVLFEGTRNALM